MNSNQRLIKNIREIARPLRTEKNLDSLISLIDSRPYVLLGEASHGTHEYYTWRMEISKRLITEQGFRFIAVEGDWPDCYRVNRYIKGYKYSGKSAFAVLHEFERWPTWMWANWEMVEFIEWLKKYNQDLADDKKIGFYGLDIYSLWESMHALIDHIKKNQPDVLDQAIKVYECFEPYREDAQEYARAQNYVSSSCEDEVVNLLIKLISARPEIHDGEYESHFAAQQNAFVIKNAEEYYRHMMHGGAHTWNLRDRHMVDTLDRLMEFHGKDAKGIVWAHNTHVGDARYTDMVQVGEYNVGQLVRERHQKEKVLLVGFGSYTGEVIAGRYWEAPMEVMKVPDAKQGSWEDVFHHASPENKLLLFNNKGKLSEQFFDWRGHRAIGVVYNPERELGNYVPTVLPERYDAFLYFDKTKALDPLHIKPEQKEVPETYPWAV